jgi:TPP-dependent pyruvate/acetoin dehydrogenase alpha subunit
MKHTVGSLQAFERDIAEEFNAGRIRAPVHLDGGNEAQLIAYFDAYFRPGDWICCSWRSHYKALLAGVPPEVLKAEIVAGRSIAVCLPEYRVLSSAIVGGNIPIALGIAWSLKWARERHPNHDALERAVWPAVHCFVGDMSATGGAFHEARRYALGHDLPLRLIVEDNGVSVLTDTQEVWGSTTRTLGGGQARDVAVKGALETRFSYELPWPHSGAGKRVEF